MWRISRLWTLASFNSCVCNAIIVMTTYLANQLMWLGFIASYCLLWLRSLLNIHLVYQSNAQVVPSVSYTCGIRNKQFSLLLGNPWWRTGPVPYAVRYRLSPNNGPGISIALVVLTALKAWGMCDVTNLYQCDLLLACPKDGFLLRGEWEFVFFVGMLTDRVIITDTLMVFGG